MIKKANNILTPVYLEVGTKRVFAGALDWPGWCRSGRDEASALARLVDYTPRYAAVLKAAGLEFTAPSAVAHLSVVERLPGNFDTNFGSLSAIPTGDSLPLVGEELEHQQAILEACWRAFDAVLAAAQGKPLRTGPRGGGRDLDGIARHVRDGAKSYLYRLGLRFEAPDSGEIADDLLRVQLACRQALETASHTALPSTGPHGGVRWKPRYFVRRSAWHLLDHAWEIEDRVS